MERKFASKLSQLRPAAEARKQASSQLKESIQLNKYRPIDPVDYDQYVEANQAALRKDQYYPALIALPADDVYAADGDIGPESTAVSAAAPAGLFVADCLATYRNRRCEVKYRYHAFGGNYRQLPAESEPQSEPSERPELFYEVDFDEAAQKSAAAAAGAPETGAQLKRLATSANPASSPRSAALGAVGVEKHGWLGYKTASAGQQLAQVKSKDFKRRFFHLHPAVAGGPAGTTSRANSIDVRKRNSVCVASQRAATGLRAGPHVLECFKEMQVFGEQQEQAETPRSQLQIEKNVVQINNTSARYGPNSFELVEKTPAGQVHHLFVAESQKSFDEWFGALEKLIVVPGGVGARFTSTLKKMAPLAADKRNSASIVTTSASSTTSSASSMSGAGSTSPVPPAVASVTTPTSSASSLKSASPGIPASTASYSEATNEQQHRLLDGLDLDRPAELVSPLADAYRPLVELRGAAATGSAAFDLDKFLAEHDERLAEPTVESSGGYLGRLLDSRNPFEIYTPKESDLVDEETELECAWPERAAGRRLLIELRQFKLNLNYPIETPRTAINPEIFFVTFALYDARNAQKLSENFYWTPDFDVFQRELPKPTGTRVRPNKAAAFGGASTPPLFSLDGLVVKETPAALAPEPGFFAELKQEVLSRLRRALLTVLDVHEEIYLVARVEKCLNGGSVHASVQPYLIQTAASEATKTKSALKLNKKQRQLLKTKLAAYRMPFAWAARPVYRRAAATAKAVFELDRDAEFQIFEQDGQHLSDEDLYKYLADLRLKEKYLYKLVQLGGLLDVGLIDLEPEAASSSPELADAVLVDESFRLKAPEAAKVDPDADYVLSVGYFEPQLVGGPAQSQTGVASTSASPNTTVDKRTLKCASEHLNSRQLSPQPRPVTTADCVTASGKLVTSACLLSSPAAALPTVAPSAEAQAQLAKRARLLRSNAEFRSFLYVYPKALKFDTQKSFSRARNILVKTEFRTVDRPDESGAGLACFVNPSADLSGSSGSLFAASHSSLVTHHNKLPQFYDEIKLLLPLNLTEKHHLLFKFYHVSCSSAKLLTKKSGEAESPASGDQTSTEIGSVASLNGLLGARNVETPIGYAWLPLFKNGRLVAGERQLPVAQSLCADYLAFEQIGFGKSVGPSEIRWVEGMKPLFRVALHAQSTVHTTDVHVANFFYQCEKLSASLNTAAASTAAPAEAADPDQAPAVVSYSSNKEITIVLGDASKESLKNSVKQPQPLNMLWSKPVKEELTLAYHVKALHATEITTVVKFLPTLLGRVLRTLVTTVSGDVAIHSVRALLYFAWQASSVGKIENLKAFVKYLFHVDYSRLVAGESGPTVHEELVAHLVILIRQLLPMHDLAQISRVFKNCWFFLECTLKSLCLYTVQYRAQHGATARPQFDADFYNSLRCLYELLVELIIKYSGCVAKDAELVSAYKCCNRSLAMFVKKSLNILNRKFLFCLVNKYLEHFHMCDKQLFEIKFDFIRIFCNHEHYVNFSLPVRKSIASITEFADFKYEFVLSDQYRQFHFPAGVLLSQLCISLNENKDLRRLAIGIFRNTLCKHSFDARYRSDRMKQARIASLYLPFIDMMLENLARLQPGSTSGASEPAASVTTGSNKPSLARSQTESSANATRLGSNTSGLGSQLATVVASSASISNGSVFVSNFETSLHVSRTAGGANESSSVLGVIAGLAHTSSSRPPGGDQLDSLLGGLDTDSLSSADDGQFAKAAAAAAAKKRASSSLVTSSTTNSDNNITALNVAAMNAAGQCSSLVHETTTNASSSGAVVVKSYCVMRKDKLESAEIRDLLVCLVFVLRSMSHDDLLGLWYNYDDHELVDFLTLLELCLRTFRYRGRAHILRLNAISRSHDLATVKSPRLAENRPPGVDETAVEREAALCHQVGIVVLKILALLLVHQKEKLAESAAVARRLAELHFHLLQSNQSEPVKLKTFASLRALVAKTPAVFLDAAPANAGLCAGLCLELLKCFQSKVRSVRLEAALLLYLLMRKNYEQSGRTRSMALVHAQIVIAVSQLVGSMRLTGSAEVLECLSTLNGLAAADARFRASGFVLEVKDLTRRIRDIFLATSQMKACQDDAEMLVEAQYRLAKSYTHSAELRRTWLDSMAAVHVREKNHAEAAHCYLHIAALIAENLRHQGMYTLGSSVFRKITPNIDLEAEMGADSSGCGGASSFMFEGDSSSTACCVGELADLGQTQYTQTQLLDYLIRSTDMLKAAERFDSLPNIFKLAVAIYETNRDYEHLQQMHQNIQRAYSYMAERDQRAREKPLGAYYRISYYGRAFGDENNKVYIYKEPGNTKLFEVCDRLRKSYAKRFGGAEHVEILSDSRKPAELKLDTSAKNYIQVTYVQPYFDEQELAERVSYYERHNNLKRFYYETPYQLKETTTAAETEPCAHAELLRLCKRKTILETSHYFPYVKKRILVVYEKPVELNPLETAIDELKQKVEDFELVLKKRDLTLLELYLQGGIVPQVHKGPLAYAEAFLEPNELNAAYPKELKRQFKLVFRRLVELYQRGIEAYAALAATQTPAAAATVTSDESSNKSSTTMATLPAGNRCAEMLGLLQEKFGEFENTFRNLLLIDGDFELYNQQLKNSRTSVELAGSQTASSQA